MKKALTYLTLTLLLLFISPALAAIGFWAARDHPTSWRNADWSSAGILPQAVADENAVIYILSARTGGLKGALATHSWIVTKAKRSDAYNRYDKVGWGLPIRKNAYDADSRWYSNNPQIVLAIKGEDADRLIPAIEAAIAGYPHSDKGDYQIWPGPNSNTFVAHVLRAVPDLDIQLPPEAVGRDYPSEGKMFWASKDRHEYRFSLWGYAGIAAGKSTGFELNFLGLVFGFEVVNPAIKLPGFGRLELATT